MSTTGGAQASDRGRIIKLAHLTGGQVVDHMRLQRFTPIAGYDDACAFDKQQVRQFYPEVAL